MKLIKDDKITDATPNDVAEMFWDMNQKEQAAFFNHLDEISDYHFPFQLQAITEDDGLTLAGRRVMQSIGEYSHWGITCKIMEEIK